MMYLLMDGRYSSDADRAICYETCETREQAEASLKNWPDDTVIVEEDWEDN